MNAFEVHIASPDGSCFRGRAASLSLRGSEGDLAVMRGHVPFVTGVQPCECRIVLEDGRTRKARVNGGLLTVGKDLTTLLTTGFEWSEE